MKVLPKRWPKDENSQTIGFLAQAALELVHPKSWESYKLPTLSPIWRLLELRRISESVMRGVLPQKALEPMVEETNSSLCADRAIAEILEVRSIDVVDLTIKHDEKAHDIASHCEFSMTLLRPNYRSTLEDLIVKECFDRQRRSEIYSMLKNYFTDLVLSGQSKESIEFAVRSHFFSEVPNRLDKRLVRNFFRRFPKERRNYNVYGVATPAFIHAGTYIVPIEVVEGRRIPKRLSSIRRIAKTERCFVVKQSVRDAYSAGLQTGKFLNAVEAVLALFPGDEIGRTPEKLYVLDESGGELLEVSSSRSFEKRILSHSTNSAIRHVERFGVLLEGEREIDGLVGANLPRAILTAALAEKSTAPEVKLLTLWASFEALLPLVPDGAGNRIGHFLDYIVPAASISYPRECFLEFARDADRLHNLAFSRYLSTLPGNQQPSDKLAAVIINGSTDQKAELCGVFADNPLALYRLRDLESKFGTVADFEKTMQAHALRVRWQIQRIYRERNTVMHNGESSPFIEQLLSNIHYYFLLVYSNIEAVAKLYGGLSTSQALSAIKKLADADYARLTRAKSRLKQNPVEAHAILLQIVAGHYR